jgi:hypothetical protein
MDEEAERYVRIVRDPDDDEFVITPPDNLKDFVEELGQDPRRPRTAIARFVSRTWAEVQWLNYRARDTVAEHSMNVNDKETINRPAHYPTDFGLGLIPHPDTMTSLSNVWSTAGPTTHCYANLASPKPFDPHLHNGYTGADDGFGYLYASASIFPDQYDLTSRRGGGPRGGFAFTTGPTEGNYPTSVLPSPTFNLGKLGYSNGGWNPEGLQWMNRPRQFQLGNLRNNWPHKVFFVRSRQVFGRTIYGQISEDEATPKTPIVMINGSRPLHGVRTISSKDNLNTPRELTITISSVAGRRSGVASIGETIQVHLAPRMWSNPPLIFTGYVAGIEESSESIRLTCLDALGFLTNEYITEQPAHANGNIATLIKSIVANSSYNPPIARIISDLSFTLPTGLKFKGKTRLAAIQTLLSFVNSGPIQYQIYADAYGYIHVAKKKELHDSTLTPYTAGRVPKTLVPLDFYPTMIERNANDDDFFNKVTIENEGLNISATVSLGSERPVHRYIKDDSVTTVAHAETLGRQILLRQGIAYSQWIVEGLPERFDLRAGDIMDFASVDGGLAGRQEIFDVNWEYSTTDSVMTITVGKQPSDIAATMRLASSLTVQ